MVKQVLGGWWAIAGPVAKTTKARFEGKKEKKVGGWGRPGKKKGRKKLDNGKRNRRGLLGLQYDFRKSIIATVDRITLEVDFCNPSDLSNTFRFCCRDQLKLPELRSAIRAVWMAIVEFESHF